MERLKERLQIADQALSRLEEALMIEIPSLMERDATIQLFEFSFEALWKVAKEYLYRLEGLDLASPKGVIRSCRELAILNDRSASSRSVHNSILSHLIISGTPNVTGFQGLLYFWGDCLTPPH